MREGPVTVLVSCALVMIVLCVLVISIAGCCSPPPARAAVDYRCDDPNWCNRMTCTAAPGEYPVCQTTAMACMRPATCPNVELRSGRW